MYWFGCFLMVVGLACVIGLAHLSILCSMIMVTDREPKPIPQELLDLRFLNGRAKWLHTDRWAGMFSPAEILVLIEAGVTHHYSWIEKHCRRAVAKGDTTHIWFVFNQRKLDLKLPPVTGWRGSMKQELTCRF